MIIPFNVFGQYMYDNYLDVKIARAYELWESIYLSSESFFYLYDKDNLREIAEINEKNIIISYNNDEIEILDSNYTLLETIPADGSVVIGTPDSIIKVAENRYRDFITFLVKDKIHLINHIYIWKIIFMG